MMFKALKWLRIYVFSGAVAILLLALLPWVAAQSAPAKEREFALRDLMVIEKKGRLLAFASLSAGFPPKLIEVVHSGVTTRFVYEISLMRTRRLFYDSEVFSRELVHQVKYDAIKKAYAFYAGKAGGEGARKVTRNRAEMMDWMAELNGEPIATVQELDTESEYYLRVRAKVNSVDFAFPFNYLLSFLGKKTDWATSPVFGARGM